MSTGSRPLHRLGLIADVQYVDDDDAFNYSKTRRRYYRQSLQHLSQAIARWKTEEVDRVMQLGDLIDGKSHRLGKRDRDFDSLREVINTLPVPWHHCIGNHELYNFTEPELREWMSDDSRIQMGDNNYYAFSPIAGYAAIVLNSYEISDVSQSSIHVAPDTLLSPRMNDARQLLETNNPNQDKNSPTGLEGVERRWCAFNGGLGRDQLHWLDERLEEARMKGEKVILVSHVPVEPKACAEVLDLAWDYDEAQKVIAKHTDCIVAVFAGHDHDGNHYYDGEANILYVTFKAVLETKSDSCAFAVCDLHQDRLELRGFGEIPSFVVRF